jgi:hypothetical protein
VVASIEVVAAAVEKVVVGAPVLVDGTSVVEEDVSEDFSVAEVGSVFDVSVGVECVSVAAVVCECCTGGPTAFGLAVVVASA